MDIFTVFFACFMGLTIYQWIRGAALRATGRKGYADYSKGESIKSAVRLAIFYDFVTAATVSIEALRVKYGAEPVREFGLDRTRVLEAWQQRQARQLQLACGEFASGIATWMDNNRPTSLTIDTIHTYAMQARDRYARERTTAATEVMNRWGVQAQDIAQDLGLIYLEDVLTICQGVMNEHRTRRAAANTSRPVRAAGRPPRQPTRVEETLEELGLTPPPEAAGSQADPLQWTKQPAQPVAPDEPPTPPGERKRMMGR